MENQEIRDEMQFNAKVEALEVDEMGEFVESPIKEELDLIRLEKVARKSHHMATLDELRLDFLDNLYEVFSPCEPGPWSHTVLGETEDGVSTELTLGYEAQGDSIPERDTLNEDWESAQSQADWDSRMEALADSVIRKEVAEVRTEYFARCVQYFCRERSRQELRAHRARFWKRILDARRKASKTGLWFLVPLDKKQVREIEYLFKGALASASD